MTQSANRPHQLLRSWFRIAPVITAVALAGCGAEDPDAIGLDSVPEPDAAPVEPTPDAAPEASPEAAPEDSGSAWSSLCTYDDGTPVLYDHTRGLVDEYSFELAMSCDLGGFMSPLVEADPVELSQVAAFNMDLADWLRARILGCSDSSTTAGEEAFLLVPPSQVDGMSKGDFKDIIKLFGDILNRHEGMPDAMTVEARNELRKRLQTFEKAVVKQETLEHTKPSKAPDCNP